MLVHCVAMASWKELPKLYNVSGTNGMTTEDNYIDTALLVTGTGGFSPDDTYMTKRESLGIAIGPLSFYKYNLQGQH